MSIWPVIHNALDEKMNNLGIIHLFSLRFTIWCIVKWTATVKGVKNSKKDTAVFTNIQ